MTKREGLPNYDGIELPPLVAAALEAARKAGFPLACTPEVGRLLQLLAAPPRPVPRFHGDGRAVIG